VISGGGGDYAAALIAGQTRDKVQSAAHLECAGRIVVFVLDVNRQARFRVQQRVTQERRRAQCSVNDLAGSLDVVESNG
jgi:hypothetical protein